MAARQNLDDGVNDTALVREICAAVADLGAMPNRRERLWAVLRLVLLTAVLFSAAWLYWLLPLGWAAISAVLLAGVAGCTACITAGTAAMPATLSAPRPCRRNWRLSGDGAICCSAIRCRFGCSCWAE
jgi:hypothetical protein